MKSEYFVCIITHGDLADSLRGAVSQLGVLSLPVHCFSNKKKSMKIIEQEIQNLITEHNPQNGIVFVDFMGGSCWLSANRLKKERKDLAVLSGVNLPMLLSFFMNYQRLDWPELLLKIVEDAKKGIVKR